MSKHFLFCIMTVVSLFLTACIEKEKEITVESIAISQPSAEMEIGETLNLKASVSPSNATFDGITWSSTKSSVATVSASGQVSALAEGNTTITAMAGGKTASCSVTVVKGYVAVSSISLNKDRIELFEGDSETLTATVSPSDATDKTVSWTSSKESVAKVKDGIITAVKEGEATITAKAGEKTASCKVVVLKKAVLEAIDLGLSVKWASCNLGATKPEEYGDYYAWGEIEPYYNSRIPVSWKDDKKAGYSWFSYKWCRGSEKSLIKYCTDPSYGYNGFMDGKTFLDSEDDAAHVKLGGNWRMPTSSEIQELIEKCSWDWQTLNGINGYIVTGPSRRSIFLPAAGFWFDTLWGASRQSGLFFSLSLSDEKPTSASYLLCRSDGVFLNSTRRYYGQSIRPVYGDSASSIPVQSVSLDKSQLDLAVGQTYTLTATVKPSNATNKSVTWSSSNTSVATVSSSGLVTAKATGQATIKVKTNDGGKTATCTVKVTTSKVSVTGVSLDKTSLTMLVGDTQTLTATVSPSNATNKSVTWTSSNTSAATVSSSGVVTAKATGQATITIMTNDGGFTATCNVTVSTPSYPVATPEAIDLGLPSGLKWASFNLGATKPEEHGDSFAWGEIEPKTADNIETYKFYSSGLTKYCHDPEHGYNGFTDDKYILDPEDDAAHMLLGGKWRMPTKKEMNELLQFCDWKPVLSNFTFEVTGPSGKSIILPLDGYDKWYPGGVLAFNKFAYYLTSSLGDNSLDDYLLLIQFYTRDNLYMHDHLMTQERRSRAHSIRPVSD